MSSVAALTDSNKVWILPGKSFYNLPCAVLTPVIDKKDAALFTYLFFFDQQL